MEQRVGAVGGDYGIILNRTRRRCTIPSQRGKLVSIGYDTK